MASEKNNHDLLKYNPAHFTLSRITTSYDVHFAVIILNQPIEDKALLVDICSRGIFDCIGQIHVFMG